MLQKLRAIQKVESPKEAFSSLDEAEVIQEAVIEHSLKFPYSVNHAVNVSSTPFDLSSITGWDEETWSVVKVYKSQSELPPDYWSVSYDDSGSQVLNLSVTGDIVIRYTRPHVCTQSLCTLREDEIPHVAHLVCSYLYQRLSNHYTRKSQASIDSDAVEHKSVAGEYFIKASDERRIYERWAGKRGRRGSVRVDFDGRSQTGRSLIFRDGRYQ